MISTVSPRTRNVPRVNARSLRVYCMLTNWRSSSSRSTGRPTASRDHPVDVLLRRAQAVDARHRGDDDDVAPGQQRVGRRVPQPLDLVVDRRVLLDVGVRLRDVRLGLVVVVVRDEVLDRVVRQQLAELVGQLRGERLVGRHHQRRPLHLLDEPGRRRATCRCRWRRAGRRPSPPPGSAPSARRSPSAGRRSAGSRRSPRTGRRCAGGR